jgi:hypothetical protein
MYTMWQISDGLIEVIADNDMLIEVITDNDMLQGFAVTERFDR